MLLSKSFKIVFVGYDNSEIFLSGSLEDKITVESYKSVHYLLNRVEKDEYFDFAFVNYDSIHDGDMNFLFAIKKSLPNIHVVIEYSTVFAFTKLDDIINNGMYSIVKKNNLISHWQYIEMLQNDIIIVCPKIMNAYFLCKQYMRTNIEEKGYINISELELQILMYLSKGNSYMEIANNMNFGINTLRYHIKKTYRKLRVHNRSSAIELYFKNMISAQPIERLD